MKATQYCGAALLRVLATVLVLIWQIYAAYATSPFNVLAPWQLPSTSASWEGAWSSAVQYSYGEIVTYSGSFWIANNPQAGTAPGVTFGQWTLFAALATSIAPGTTTISGGTSGDVEYNNAGVLGELPPTISGITLGNNLDALTFGAHLSAGGSSYNGSAAVTISSDATNADTASTIVARDSSGNFNAGTITASVAGHSSLDLAIANNLSDVASELTARTNLGLGSLATENAVTLAQLPNIGQDTVLGNVSGGETVPAALSQTQLTALINPCSATLAGDVPTPPNSTTEFLRGDCTWQTVTGAPSLPLNEIFVGNSSSVATPSTSLPNGFSAGTSLYPSIASPVDRYNSTSAFIANTLGGEYGLFGLASKDSSTTWLNTYVPGVDSPGQVALYSISPNGLWGGVFASRSSDNPSGSNNNVSGSYSIAVHDSTTEPDLVWGSYSAAYVTSTAAPGHSIGHEISLFNSGTNVAEDPYNFNPTGSSVAGRYDCADYGTFGGNDCSALMDLVPNGAMAHAGLVIASGALDNSSNPYPPAIALANCYASVWYSAAATPFSSVFACNDPVATGSSATVSAGSGLITVIDPTVNHVSIYMCSSGVCTQGTANPSTGNVWVASSSTPTSGKMSIAYNGSAYAIYNNTGATVSVHAIVQETNLTP